MIRPRVPVSLMNCSNSGITASFQPRTSGVTVSHALELFGGKYISVRGVASSELPHAHNTKTEKNNKYRMRLRYKLTITKLQLITLIRTYEIDSSSRTYNIIVSGFGDIAILGASALRTRKSLPFVEVRRSQKDLVHFLQKWS